MKIDMDVMKKVVRARWMRARYGAVETLVSVAGAEACKGLAEACEDLAGACEGTPRSKWACRVVRRAASGELAAAAAAVAAAGVAFAQASEGAGAAANALMWAVAEAARQVVSRTWDITAFTDAKAAWGTFVGWRCDVHGDGAVPEDDPVMIRGGDEAAAAEINALERIARGWYPEAGDDLPF